MLSRSKKSGLSAFQVMSSTPKNSSNQSKKQRSQESIFRKKQDIKGTPRSLIDMVHEADERSRRPQTHNKKSNDVNPKHTKGDISKSGRIGPVKSLLDISFDTPSPQRGRQLQSYRQDQKMKSGIIISRATGVRHRSLLKDAKDKKHSSEESRIPSSSKLESSEKESHIVDRPSKPSPKPLLSLTSVPAKSNIKPLIVDFQSTKKTSRPPPESLLSMIHVSSSYKNKRFFDSLSRKEFNIESSSSKGRELRSLQGLKDSKKRKMEEKTTIISTGNEMNSNPHYKSDTTINKRRKLALEPISKKIRTCQGKKCCYLVIPASCSWLHISGRAHMCVERGIVNIMAFTLQPKVTYDVYSPASGCLLALHVENTSKISDSQVMEELSGLCEPGFEENLKDLNDDTIAVIKVKPLESHVCDYLASFIPFTQLFKVNSRENDKSNHQGVVLFNHALKVAPLSEMTHPCMNWSPEYNDALWEWSGRVSSQNPGGPSPILLTCGGKNSGKSILNRCAVNMALQSVQEVAYLDCDVGQTEFSPPATVSLHVIKDPVLGPPFCHQRHAERMVFYGDVSPSQDPGFYIRCLKHVFQAYSDIASQSYMPLIVNTMGFPEGVGLMLFIDTMNIVKPDLVIQLTTTPHFNNFPPITRQMVAVDEGWTYNKIPPEDPEAKIADTKEHKLIGLSSLSSPKRDFSMKLQPYDLRNLSLLASLSTGLEKDMTLLSLTPYAVPYKHLAVHVCHHKLPSKEILIALDASVVALCEADLSQATKDDGDDLPWMFDETPICHCLGLGLIRAVDLTKGVLFLVTTLPRFKLKKVNTVLKGSLALPDLFFLNQKSNKPLPYVDALAPSTAVAAVRPRSRMPRMSSGKESKP